MNSLQALGALELGLIYAIVAVGVTLTFRVIDFPDLTVDGSFVLGAATAAALIIAGWNPLGATLVAMLAGALSGAATGILHVRWKILGLLAGILTMTALYSVNLRIMGRPNLALVHNDTLFTGQIPNVILAGVVLVLVLALTRLLSSHLGLAIRAVGVNERGSAAYGIHVGRMKVLALALSNAIVALAGALFAQSQGFADVSMGTGTVIVGLASVIVGETVLHPRTIVALLMAAVAGSIVYRFAIALALNATGTGLQASDLNMITAALVAGTLMVKRRKS